MGSNSGAANGSDPSSVVEENVGKMPSLPSVSKVLLCASMRPL